MVGKRKLAKLIIKELSFEPVEANAKPGKWAPSHKTKPNSKDRRHSGRISSRFANPKSKYKDAHAEGIDEILFYDDWKDFRDGQRDKDRDLSRIKPVEDYSTRGIIFHPYREDFIDRNKILLKHEEIRRIRKLIKRLKRKVLPVDL